jgi:ABC-type Mn2+/Zn2+ transport system ATPase subunit
MPVRMKSLRIQGFKAIGDATLHWHPRVNVITGPNNSGKTTVLESLALWAESFGRMCFQAGKAMPARGVRRNDWYLYGASAHHSEIVSVRSPGFDDLFYRGSDNLTLTAALVDDAGEFEIPIHIRKARGGNYDFSCSASDSTTNPRLNTSFTAMPQPFRVLFASPVAAVLTSEEFLTPGKTADMIRQRRSAEVLRNRIHRLYGRANDFQRFNDDVSRVLTGGTHDTLIEVRGDPNKNVRATVLARSNRNDNMRDISLLGSGSLQVIEVLLNLYLSETDSDLDLVLLDEPDSHIHRDVQRRLLDIIEEKAQHAQVFATTHNESLLRSAGWDRVFHLTPAPAETPRVFKPLGDERVVTQGRQHGLIPSPLRSALSSVGAETALDFLNALESQHFLLVEGGSDAVLLDRMLAVARFGAPRETAMYWSLNGIDGGLRTLHALKVVLSNIRNERNLWEKAHLVLDRDLLTDRHVETIARAVTNDLKLKVSFWAARTAEAALLSGGPSLALAHLLRQVALTNRLPGITDNDDNASTACLRAWDSLGNRLREIWGKPRYEVLGAQLKHRSQLVNEVFPKSFTTDVPKLQEEVNTFHNDAISAGRYHESADKHDVAAFVVEALQHMGVDQEAAQAWRNGPNWFGALVAELKSVQEFPALSEMLAHLRHVA